MREHHVLSHKGRAKNNTTGYRFAIRKKIDANNKKNLTTQMSTNSYNLHEINLPIKHVLPSD